MNSKGLKKFVYWSVLIALALALSGASIGVWTTPGDHVPVLHIQFRGGESR